MTREFSALLVSCLTVAGCQSITAVDGFDAVAARGEVLRIDGAGWGRSGHFAIAPAGTAGTFQRSAKATAVNGEKLALGDLKVTLAGGEFDGLSAECAHSRETFEITEQVSRGTTIQSSYLTGPYLLTCGFYRGEAAIGGIAMHEEVANDVRTLRSGRVEVGEVRMRLTSLHSGPGLALPTGEPLGYAMTYGSGDEAVLFVNGGDRRLALPKNGRDERAAAMLAGVALSLVWDPGDS
ncbi:hypothetical protein A6F68_02367 [Tsuneonella dongtanensis]|uniref:Uncharacterized protein n=1 Tax=Tsuneonella dongtanensis TaxID=692370 RepID=A0A1B2AFF5_9SPHN|nr:hypothetical protein [Tsuneonella dongtanensis]ANY20866.1 hypothetical protein A6F68_02367 [Tsuneonella dongtanensis]